MKKRSGTAPAAGRGRREFLKQSAAMAAAPMAWGLPLDGGSAAPARRPPNIVLYIADQFRADCLGAYGENPTGVTPHLDAVAREGVAFRHAVTNQPLCSPSRACLFTGKYATQTGVWTLGPGLDASPTLATLLRAQGYTANYIGKWHLAYNDAQHNVGLGPVPLAARGGFLDFWEASNVLELTSTPYAGTIWDGDGHPLTWKDQYRVDFITDRSLRFLRQPHSKPFFLVISQLEPHFQNSMNAFVAPRGYAKRYANPFVPHDLRFFPGDWQAQLPDYYGDIRRIDESVGRVLRTLEEQKLAKDTIFVFLSDHGCHFRTRNEEYKRSPHDSSIRIPLVMRGPGLNRARMLDEVVSMVDVAPTVLAAAGVMAPEEMKGRSFLPLVTSAGARRDWRQEAFIQISEAEVARALRTDEWTYCVVDVEGRRDAPGSAHYRDYQLYNLASDPHQLVNLAGRRETREITGHLRERLKIRMAEAGEPVPRIDAAAYYP